MKKVQEILESIGSGVSNLFFYIINMSFGWQWIIAVLSLVVAEVSHSLLIHIIFLAIGWAFTITLIGKLIHKTIRDSFIEGIKKVVDDETSK